MILEVAKEFKPLGITSGIIQNTSTISTLEISDTNEFGSGIFIYPLCEHAFTDKTLYVRCIDGTARVRIVEPFELNSNGGGNVTIIGGSSYVLPTASEYVKGGIKIGTGLSMADETLNVTLDCSLPIATQNLLGGVKVGDNLSITSDGVLSCTVTGGGEDNVIEAVNIDGLPQPIRDKTVMINLSEYAKKADVTNLFRYKSSVYSYDYLPTAGMQIGDVYNIENDGGKDFKGIDIKAGDNVVWNGSSWDVLGGTCEFEQYTLPPATRDSLGGIIVGDGLKITNSGKLNVTLNPGDTNIIEKISLDGVQQTISNKTAILDLSAYAKNRDIGSVFRYKNSVLTFDDLPPAESVRAGDVYNIRKAGGTDAYGTSIEAGDNVVWNGGTWDILAGNFELPTASENVKGGIIVGDGLKITARGVLSCNISQAECVKYKGVLGTLDLLPENPELYEMWQYVGSTVNTARPLLIGLYHRAGSLEYTISYGDVLLWDGACWIQLTSNYTLPTASSSTKGGVKIGTGLQMNGDTLNVTLDSGDKYSVFGGATESTGGTSGLVPQPVAGENDKFLRGDGTWAEANTTVINMGGSTVVLDGGKAIQGGLWQDYVTGIGGISSTLCLKLRLNDYEYNFHYDNSEKVGTTETILETVSPMVYPLGTTPSTVDGGIWYGLNTDSLHTYEFPEIKVHRGVYNYGYFYDSITYKGNNDSLVCYMPFESTVDDAITPQQITWKKTPKNYQIVDCPLGGKALLCNSSATDVLYTGDGQQGNEVITLRPLTFDFWFYIDHDTLPSTNIKIAQIRVTSSGSSTEHSLINTGSGTITFGGVDVTSFFSPKNFNHCAVTRNNNVYTFYLNGRRAAQFTRNYNFRDVQIGYNNTDIRTYYSRFRIFNQVVWEDEFEPPKLEDYFK